MTQQDVTHTIMY